MAAAALASVPKIRFNTLAWAAVGNLDTFCPISASRAGISFRLPDASLVVTPISPSASLAILTGLARRRNICRMAVPAISPCMPASPSLPAIAATSATSIPNVAAMGATYFMVSPNMERLVLDVVNVLTRISFVLARSAACRLKPERMFDEMSAALPKSMAPAADRFSTSGNAFWDFSTPNPAIARNSIASAACVAEN